MKILCLLFTLAALFCAGCSSSVADSIGKDVEDTLSNTQHAKNRYVQMVKTAIQMNIPTGLTSKPFPISSPSHNGNILKAMTSRTSSNSLATARTRMFLSRPEFSSPSTKKPVPLKRRISLSMKYRKIV